MLNSDSPQPRPAAVSATGYVAWFALAAGPLWRLLQGQIALNAQSMAGAAALLLFPLLFALANPRAPHAPREALLRGRAGLVFQSLLAPRFSCRWLQPFVAMLACWGLAEPVLGALLIISAGQLAAVFRLPVTIAILLPADVLLFLYLRTNLDSFDLMLGTLGNTSLQAFTVFMVQATQRAHEVRDQVMRVNAELMATRQLLLEGARDEERLRISRELHDVMGHKLTALKLQLRLRARAASTASAVRLTEPRRDDAMAQLESAEICMRLADDLLNDVRGVVSALRASDGIDLHQALSALMPAVTHPAIEINLAPDALVPNLQQAHALLRCAQEGITNALRHSNCTRLVITLKKAEQGVALSIEDDGRSGRNGRHDVAPTFGNGLLGMQERLTALGGTLEVTSAAGHGLRVTAFLPESAPLSVES